VAKEMMNPLIKSADDLVTSREETRAWFIAIALEKNYIAIPYIEEAKALKGLAAQVKKPKDLLNLRDLRVGLLTAAGLSDKSLNYLTEDDKILAIRVMRSVVRQETLQAHLEKERIRASFKKKNLKPQTFFIRAAIETAMAVEIFKQLQTGIIDLLH
jgi:hypothetical protein